MNVGEINDNSIFTGREVKRMFRELLEADGSVMVSTVDASKILGHSPDWWRRAAPEIPGAFQEADGGPWTLPLGACREHVLRLSKAGKLRRRDGERAKRLRGPWKGRPAPQIVAVP